MVSFEFTSELNRKLCELCNQTPDFIFKQQASVSQLIDIESEVKEIDVR